MEGYDLFSDDLPTLGSSMLDGLADLGSSANDQYVGSTQSNMNAGQNTPGEQHGPTSVYNPMYPSTGDAQANSQVKMPSYGNYGTAGGYAQQQVHYSQVNQGSVSYGGTGYAPYGQQSMAPRLPPANTQYGMYGDSRMYGMQQHPAEQYQQQMHQTWPAQMGAQAYPSTMGASAQYSAVPHPSYRPLHPPQQPQQQQQHPAYGQPPMRMPAQSLYGSLNGPPAAAAAAGQMAGKNIPAGYSSSAATAAPGSTPPFGLHQQYQAYGPPNLTHANQQPKVVAQQQSQQQQQGAKPFSYPMQPPYPAMNAQQQHFSLAESAAHQDIASLYPAAASGPSQQQQQQQLHPPYRAPFPQMSPQMSPRPQASPMSHQGPAAPVQQQQQPSVSAAPTFLPPHHPQQHGPPLGSHPVPPQAQQQPMQQSMPTSLQQLEQLVGTNSTPPKPNLPTSAAPSQAAAIPSPSRTPVPSSPAPPRTPVSSSPAHHPPGPSPRVAVSSPLPLLGAALSSPLPVQQPEQQHLQQQHHRDTESQVEPPEAVKSPLAMTTLEVKEAAVPPLPPPLSAEMSAAAPKQPQQPEALPTPSPSAAPVPAAEAAPQPVQPPLAPQPPPTAAQYVQPIAQPYIQQPVPIDPAARVNASAAPPPPHVEMQHFQQQLQQLYSLPPNPQTQQQINDIHERLAVLQRPYVPAPAMVPAAAQVPPPTWPSQQFNPPPAAYGPPPAQAVMAGPMGPPPAQTAGQIYDFPGVSDEPPTKAKKKRERKKTPKEPKEPKTPKTPKAKSGSQMMSSIESTIMSVSSSAPAAEQEHPAAGEAVDVLEAAVAAITEPEMTSDSMKLYQGEEEELVTKDPPDEDPGSPESTPKGKRTRNRKAKSSRKRDLETADAEEAEEIKPSKPKRIRIYKKKSKQQQEAGEAVDSGTENFGAAESAGAAAAGDSGGPAETGSAEESTNAFSDSANASVNAGSSSSTTKKKRPPRVKASSSSSKKRPSRTTLSFSKKNRRRRMSEGDPSDMEGEPAPSPIAGDDDGVLKRRSGRNTSRKKYVDDIDLSLSEEDTSAAANADAILTSAEGDVTVDGDQSQNGAKPNFVYVNTTEEDSMVVQHILASRMGTREIEDEEETPAEEDTVEKTEGEAANTEDTEKPKKPPKTIEVEEYYVKYKNFSYLHCEWKTEEELMRGDKRFNAKLKRYLQKKAQASNTFEFLEEETFNPDYTEVDRVLDKSEHADENGKTVRNYLVKWRSLPYEDVTWELEDDVDPNKIKIYEEFNRLPPKDQWKPKKRGKSHEWKKLDESPVYKNNNTLREYQLEGLNWLSFSWFNGRNCILADEMGLGKTIQSLTFIDSVHRYGIRGPFLVIAPLSTIPNWQREFESWTNLNIIVYHGSNASRNMIQEYEFFFKDDKGHQIRDVYKFNVLITTFEMIISDCFELRDIPWRLCVIDEAHRLKNKNCKLLEGLRLLSLEHRVLLSGTPLQNNISELFSLLNFLEPNQFTSSDEFIRDFGDLKSDDQVQKLQMLLKPMMLRRLKEDVEKSLAPKEETIIEVELTNMQKKYYRGILERNFSFLTKGTTNANIPNLMNTMMELRKCCIHPYLLNGAEEQIEHDMKMTHKSEPDLHHKALIQSAGKLVLIDKLLPKLRSAGHRVLIFSQMVRCLDILEDYLIHRKYPYERLDGRIRGNMRQAAIDRFCKPDSDRFVFLLCTKAGGLGINLTAADTVIIYDSDWNPQNDLQAQARCHRIGQQKMVKVYRLLTRNTYEREMFDKASVKLGLDKAVLQSMNTSQGGKETSGTSKQLSKKEIEDLLKKGAYGALMEDDSAGDKFCEEDIDQILLRRTQIITLENEKGSTFSKASFASSNDRTDIDIDDPDFWKKWARKAEIDLEQFNGQETLVLSEPRRRTQIKRYGQDEGVMDVSELESSSNTDEEGGAPSTRSKLAGRRERRSGRSLRHSRRGANYDEDFAPDDGEVEYGGWSKTECFKVEKGLLTFGWGRWREIMAHGQFRKGWRESDVEDCARIMLLFCIQFYHGDERVKSFVWDLITPTENGQPRVERNHSGLAAPLLRGRKGKKKGKDGKSAGQFEGLDWTKDDKYDPEQNLDGGYRRHASRYSNKIMLRVRLLYYIKSEIIGELENQVNVGMSVSALPLQPPFCDQPPAPWWDTEADVSLLVGTYKHGYERYAVMRLDPALSFLARCGPPDRQELLSEMASLEAANGEDLDKAGDDEEDLDDDSSSNQGPTSSSSAAVRAPVSQAPGEKFAFPPVTELNTRLRRLVTSYQRNFKKEELKLAQKAKRIERRERIETIVREREKQKMEVQQRRWTRREEADFFRTISNFGVEYNKKLGKYDWSKFRSISRLDRKFDETLTEYLRAFCAMCKKACGRKLTEEEEVAQSLVEPVTEERARRCLERLELLCKIREEVLCNAKLEERLKLCQMSQDLPDWWVPGKHDKDLLVGAAKHGLGRTDFYFVHDPELGFREILRRHYANEPLIYPREKIDRDGKEKEKEKKEEAKPDKEEREKEVDEKEAKLETANVEEETPKEEVKTEPKEEEKQEKVEEREKEVEKEEEEEEEKKEEPKEEEVEKVLKMESEEKEERESKIDEKEETESKIDEKEEEKESEEKVEEKKEDNEEADKPKIDEKKEEKNGGTEKEMKGKEEEEENNDETEEPLSLRMKKAEEKEKKTLEKTESKPKEKLDESRDKKKGKSEKKKEFEFTPPPLASLAQMDEAMARQGLLLDPDLLANGDPAVLQILAQAYQNPIRWPKDRAVEARLQHIVHAVEKNEWPVGTDFTVFTNGVTEDTCLTPDPSNTPPPAVRDTPTPASLSAMSLSDASDIMMMGDRNTEFGLGLLPSVRRGRGRGRGRGSRGRAQQQRSVTVDMEAERARLRALLSLNHSMQRSLNQQLSGKYADDDEPRAAAEGSHSLRSKQRSFPPPAHQQGSSRSAAQLSAQALELMLAQAAQAQAQVLQAAQAQSSAAALASSMAALGLPPSISVSVTTKNSDQGSSSAPMDLSGGVGKKEVNGDDEDDRKRKNDDGMPPPGKEKKRRKLDEIVLGLSAAKGGQGSNLFASPAGSSKSGNKSESSTPLGISFPRSSGITILPCSKDKEDKSSKETAAHKLTAQMIEAQALLVGLGRLPGVSVATPSSSKNAAADPPRISIEPLRNSGGGGVGAGESAKLPDFLLQKLEAYNNTPPHELKVSKWLAEQQGITPERPSSPDAEMPDERRHRRSRIDPALLDWNRLSGDEHVSVINRLTGKKITGSKAPQLRDLGPWLLSNPMFNVDPKWAELVKEKGNLPGDLQARVSSSDSKSAGANPNTSSSSGSKDKKPLARTSTSSSAKASTSGTSATASTSGLTNNPFGSFPGMNPNFLALGGFDAKNPLLAAFDPKNPLFGALDPKTAALFGASLDPKNAMAGMDPKNQLLFPFSGLPGLGALGGLGGLGLGSMSNPLFSSLAGFMPELASSSSASQSKTTTSSSSTRREDKGKKPMATTSTSSSAAATSSASTPTSSSAAAAAAAAMPFLFPNPSLLYGHLGLGGLGFPLPTGIPLSTAFSNLNVQAGLMNGLMTMAATDPASTSTKTTSAVATKTSSSSSRANASTKERPSESQKRERDRDRDRDSKESKDKDRDVKSKERETEKDVGLDLSKSSKSDEKEEKKTPEKRSKDNVK